MAQACEYKSDGYGFDVCAPASGLISVAVVMCYHLAGLMMEYALRYDGSSLRNIK